jgi:phospholipid/cholesterol/gamma-HCH transport system substrate-binding protein
MRDEVKVGAFVALAATTLLVLTLWILGRGLMGGSGSPYVVRLPHAGGVVAGDRVRVAGVATGRVDSVTLEPAAELPVRVEVSLSQAVVLHQDASAALRADSLLGGNYLEIEPGTADLPRLESGSEIAGTERFSLDTAFRALTELSGTADLTLLKLQESVEILTSALEPTIARLQAVLSDQNVENLGLLMSEGAATLSEIRPQLLELLDRADWLVIRLEEATTEVPELVASARGLSDDLRVALGEDGEKLSAVLDSARSTLDSLDAGEGEIASLVEDLSVAAANLRSLSESLRERPSSLLGLRAARDRRPGEASSPSEGRP